MADDTAALSEASIRETYLSLRQRAERQALAEFTEYVNAPSRQAVNNYQEVIGRVTGSGADTSIASSGRWFTNPLADANKDGQISTGEIEALENFERSQLVGAAIVMDRVNELVQHPDQMTNTAQSMPLSAIQERFSALDKQHESKASLRDYISKGLQEGFAHVAQTENARASALAEQERIRNTPAQVTSLENGNTRVTTGDGTVREFTPEQIAQMQALRSAPIVLPNGTTTAPAQAPAQEPAEPAAVATNSLATAASGLTVLSATHPTLGAALAPIISVLSATGAASQLLRDGTTTNAPAEFVGPPAQVEQPPAGTPAGPAAIDANLAGLPEAERLRIAVLRESEAKPEAAVVAEAVKHTVKAGDSLDKIIRQNYPELGRDGIGYLAVRLAIEDKNRENPNIFMRDRFELRADAGEITLPTLDEVKGAFATNGKTYAAAQEDICKALNCSPTQVASQASAESKGISFA